MKRRDALKALTAAAGWLPSKAAPPAGRPNVLFVVSDDLNNHLGCYGNPLVKSPYIDRLARRGVRFEHAYCQFPLCNPTRSSVLSGRYPTNTGVLDNNTYLVLEDGQQILPEFFERNGYSVGVFGKVWHGTNRGLRRGEPKPAAPVGWFTPGERARQQAEDPDYWARTHSPYRNLRLTDPAQYAWANEFGPLKPGDDGLDAATADKALAALQQMSSQGKPFFLAVGFAKPHVPLKAPRKYFELYNPDTMRVPADFDTEPRPIENFPRDEFRQNIDLYAARSFTPREAREAIRAYYACVSYMDAQLGRLLDKLDELGLSKNTIVVLWGDHGWHLSEKGMWAKGTLFEVSARGPMIVADPRKPAGGVSRRVVEYLDLYPTLTELCGLPRPSWLDGASLVPLLEEPGAKWDRPAYTVQTRDWYLGRSVRTERWRYTEWDEGRRGSALFDHEQDPNEMRNLAQDPRCSEVTRELSRLLGTGPVAPRK